MTRQRREESAATPDERQREQRQREKARRARGARGESSGDELGAAELPEGAALDDETRRDEARGAGSAGRRAGVGAHGSAGEDYYYRRRLGRGDLMTAAGIALGAGAAAFYLASLFLQRTPLEVPRPAGRRRGRMRSPGMR